MSDVFEFTWEVPTAGYRWVNTQSAPLEVRGPRSKGLFLTAVVPPFTLRRYAPLRDQPTLFRIFAETPPTEEGILTFAAQYGGLGREAAIRILLSDIADANTPNPWGWGEPFERWQEEIHTMQRVVSLWDKVQAGDRAGLARHIHWRPGDEKGEQGVLYASWHHLPRSIEAQVDAETAARLFAFGLRKHSGDVPLPAEGKFYTAWIVRPGEQHRFRLGDLGQPALWYVQKYINQYLTERTSIAPRLLWDPEMTQLELYFVPTSLLGSLWLQFAQAIAGNKSYHQCEYCGKTFEVSLEGSRPTRLYCSDACRFKAYRKRQDDAYRLHLEKVPLKEIATRLGTNTTTAKGWIKKGKEK